jgi:chaperonin GroES
METTWHNDRQNGGYIVPRDIKGFLESKNIAEMLDSDLRANIGARVVDDYEMDKQSRSAWEERNDNSRKLATQVLEAKNTPFDNAANIKYPLLSMSCVQFSARAYPNIVKGRNVAKCKVIGEDPGGMKAGKADRTSAHMNYQLLDEMQEWETETDRMLTALPVEGCEFKKTYFDPVLGRNVSELVRPYDLVMKYKTKSLEKAVRITQHIYWTKNEAIEKIRAGEWLDIEKDMGFPPTQEGDSRQDEDAPHLFLEQHRYWDLDDDGYQEPYIVTVHYESQKVVRIKARWDVDSIQFNKAGKVIKIAPTHYFTKYYFMPSIDGSIYEMGFGDLLGPINETINTSTNQLLDSGTRKNTGGGFIGKEALGKGKEAGIITFQPGEWKVVNYRGDDIRKALVPLDWPDPSPVLFNLLGMMVEAGEKLATVTDPLLGEQPPANTPVGTTLALIEQGLKVFTAIYKRIHKSLKDELRKLFRLNRIYLNPQTYFTALDSDKPQQVLQQDYDEKSLDIIPVSDPNEVTDVLKMAKVQMLQSIPGLDQGKVADYALQASNIPDYKDFMPKEPPQPPPEIQIKMKEVQIKEAHLQLDAVKAEAEMLEMRSAAALNIAKAQGVSGKLSVEKQKNLLEHMDRQAEVRMETILGRAKVAVENKKAEKEAKSGSTKTESK